MLRQDIRTRSRENAYPPTLPRRFTLCIYIYIYIYTYIIYMRVCIYLWDHMRVTSFCVCSAERVTSPYDPHLRCRPQAAPAICWAIGNCGQAQFAPAPQEPGRMVIVDRSNAPAPQKPYMSNRRQEQKPPAYKNPPLDADAIPPDPHRCLGG
jgi:hypothetical protein